MKLSLTLKATVDEVVKEFDRRKWIREGSGADTLISTPEVLAEEQGLLTFARKSRGSVTPLSNDHVIDREWLSEEQKNAVQGVLQSSDRVQVVRGVAGSGKTTLMEEAIEGMEKQGHNVTVLAPTATAAKQVLSEFDADTLASFLINERQQDAARGSVIWVDEAGQASMPDIAKLARIAERVDARIILSGDKRQHKAVGKRLRSVKFSVALPAA